MAEQLNLRLPGARWTINFDLDALLYTFGYPNSSY